MQITEPLIEVKRISKRYRTPGVLSSLRAEGCIALRDVSFRLEHSSIVALMGASGAGKSTLVRCLCSLERPDSGEIRFEGLPLAPLRRSSSCRPIQMIFQDPGASLNPNFTAFEIIEEPLRLSRSGSRRHNRAVVSQLMEMAGLPNEWSDRKAWQFSGGQRARLAIARALAVNPKLLILDESLSGLDVSIRSAIANLLLDIQEDRGLSYLLITHDADLAAGLADRVLILRAGSLSSVAAPQKAAGFIS